MSPPTNPAADRQRPLTVEELLGAILAAVQEQTEVLKANAEAQEGLRRELERLPGERTAPR